MGFFSKKKGKKKGGMFGGYKTRQEQLDAQMQGYGLEPSPLKKEKQKGT